ncbi:MAG TPA: HAD-IG family 5'-nucleotidase [Sandaracinaceae bacterium LLY-WYZ-13_1]|nr:HAD-IG family 5'-nucleotidase [Sandaracinaceae bacterium LLY-WYZ-13_1]
MDDAYDEAHQLPEAERRIFCNRTLNLRSIRAVGFDMDYTLIHYDAEEWERHAYEDLRARLAGRGWQVQDLEFDPKMVALGLILDLEHGNVVKANRFGYIKRAAHGTRPLPYPEQRKLYARDLVDLKEPRWVFLNTLFSLSEACMYCQMVDRLDEGALEGVMGYADLYKVVRSSLDEAHMEGQLKAAIMDDPERFVLLDPQMPLALMDLQAAGKKLLLITNSEWSYTQAMMSYAFDRFLPGDTTWRDLFDIKIVSARKPAFFEHPHPWFEVIDDEGRLLPARGPQPGGTYLGGNAASVEEWLGLSGEEILYVGDHIFSDVRVSRSMLRWRTALVLRDLEAELDALEAFKPQQIELTRMMADKERLEHRFSRLRLALQRRELGYGPQPETDAEALKRQMSELREELTALDARIAPLAKASGELVNPRWGPLMRTGNDKSHLARQIERYADVYLSRVSNFLGLTPYVYLRSPRGSLPHDSGPGGGVEP